MEKKQFRGTQGDWHIDKLGNIGGDWHPICKIEKGVWGDEYPTIVLSGNSIDRKATAVMDIVAYGEIPKEEAEANSRLIVNSKVLLDICIDFVEKVERGEAKSVRTYNKMKEVIAKVLGE